MSDIISAMVGGLRGPGLTPVDRASLDGATAASVAAAARSTNAVGDAQAARADTLAARDSAVQAVASPGARYATHADAQAAAGALADGVMIEVIADETQFGARTAYRTLDGALTLVGTLASAPKQSLGGPVRVHPRNAVLCLIGDSITDPALQFQNAMPPLTGPGGPYEGWTIYNMAANGQIARNWAQSIVSGDQSAPPQNGADQGTNCWRVVNADPDDIHIMLGTNDIRMFGAGHPYGDLASATAGIRADLSAIVAFFLARTRAHITVECRPPLVYIAGSTDGYTDFASPADAAARGAALRSIVLGLANVSSRVSVIDMQRHMLPPGTAAGAYRWDSLAQAVDPEGTGSVIMLDELHYSQLGQVRRGQVIARAKDPSHPASSAVTVAPSVAHQTAMLSTRCVIKVTGTDGQGDYIDIYSDTVRNVLGQVFPNGWPRQPLINIRRYEDVVLAGANSLLGNLLRGSRVKLVDSAGGYITVVPSSVTHTQYDGSVGDYFRVRGYHSAVPAAGLADIYIDDVASLPPAAPDTLPVSIKIIGASGHGAALLPMTGVAPILLATGVNAIRADPTGACTIGLFVGNQSGGNYAGAVNAAFPGYRLGGVTIGATGYVGNAFTPDAGNFPAGVAALPDPATYLTHLRAVVESGAIGDSAEMVVRPR